MTVATDDLQVGRVDCAWTVHATPIAMVYDEHNFGRLAMASLAAMVGRA
jgi:hypothetical protein